MTLELPHHPRNWSRFLHRLWLIGTGLCVLGSLVVLYVNPRSSSTLADLEAISKPCLDDIVRRDAAHIQIPSLDERKQCADLLAIPSRYRRDLHRWYWAAFHIGVTLPVGSLLLGHAIAWALRGLRTDS